MFDSTDPTALLTNPTPPPMPPSQTAFDGLTVRDYFAAAALQGILASHSGETTLPDEKKAAKWCRQFADALLAELHDAPFPG